jgi:hypothetical protein
MDTAQGHWQRRIGLFVRDPWFWALLVIVPLLGALLAEWLPRPWGNWAPIVVLALGIMVFSTVRGQRYRDR